MLTKKEKELLDLFGSLATPSSSYHTNDMQRWSDFVFQVYKNSRRAKPVATPTQNDLMGVLSKYHFGPKHVQDLYDMLTDDLIVVSRCWWPK